MIPRPARLMPAALLATVSMLVAPASALAVPQHAQTARAARGGVAAQDEPPRWSVVPSGPEGPNGRAHFVYSLPPGGTIRDYVGISNLSDKPLTVTVYPTDAFTTIDGAFGLLAAAQTPRDVGTWITVPRHRYRIPVGKRLDLRFRVKVPADAEPGDHSGGIIASVATQEANAEGQLVTIDRRVAARVYLRVDGAARPAAQVESVSTHYSNPAIPSGGKATVTYRLSNTGNLRVTGTAFVRITGPLGFRLGQSDEISVPELLPGSVAEFTEQVDGVFPAGRAKAEVVFLAKTADGNELPGVRKSSSVWAMPWLLLAVVGLVVAVVVFRYVRRRRQTRTDEMLAPREALV